MNDSRSLARGWLAKAESDRLAARRLLDSDGPFDAVCFHAQQACEKALKAVLAWAGTDVPRMHNLEELQVVCVKALSEPTASLLKSLDLAELTPYAVETRYDAEFWPDRDTADAAVKRADEVIDHVSVHLNHDPDQDNTKTDNAGDP
ncbi:MAG: HEPN domain-containing protein [Luteitalea sp.]|nr:HEPN domain-containing protein [Luteitalea sp.]